MATSAGESEGRFLLPGKKLLHKSLVVRAQVCGNLRENVPERADSQDVMGWHRHVMLAAPDVRGKAQMTARLPGYLMSVRRSRPARSIPLRSRGDQFVFDDVQVNETRAIGWGEVAEDRVADSNSKRLERVGLRKYGVAQCSRLVAAFRRFLDLKDDFVGRHARMFAEQPSIDGPVLSSCRPLAVLKKSSAVSLQRELANEGDVAASAPADVPGVLRIPSCADDRHLYERAI